jgi:hypothetical protein
MNLNSSTWVHKCCVCIYPEACPYVTYSVGSKSRVLQATKWSPEQTPRNCDVLRLNRQEGADITSKETPHFHITKIILYMLLRKVALFILRIIWNKYIGHTLSTKCSYISLKHVAIQIVTTRFWKDRLYGLVVSVEDYKHRGPGFDSRALLRIFLKELCLERGPLSLVIG